MVQRYVFFIAFFFLVQALPAQTSYRGLPPATRTFPFGVIEEIDSKPLSETRTINIYLPQGYHPDSAATYPTIYVLDGSAHEDFPHIAGLVQFMNMYDLLPKSIVVGIANVDRYRDFTHVSEDPRDKKDLPTSGGSAKFIRFIATELQPMVRAKFKTNGHRTIIGQSLGGLLASEILLTRPELFDDYLIVSPSLWWDKQSLVKAAEKHLKAHSGLKRSVFLTVGDEHPVMVKTAKLLADAIRGSGQAALQLHYAPLPKENHATILHRAVYLGFEMLYPKIEEKKE